MSTKEDLILKEIKKIILSNEDLEMIKNKSFLVTGGNGLIGSYLLSTLSYLKEQFNLNLTLIGTVRDLNKKRDVLFNDKIDWIVWDLNSPLKLKKNVDYIIHTASSTNSKFFIEHPVELINSALNGFNTLMDYALINKVRSLVFTSSLEAYGICTEDRAVKENESFSINSSNVRSSYPLTKKIIENLCVSYSSEYNIPIKTVRLGQTFAPGVAYNDERVFADFSRRIVNNENIILLTKGETRRSYCSIQDCVFGIIKVLLYGSNGECYNLASDNSYISIYELAKLFISNTSLFIDIKENSNNPFLPTLKFALDTTKIKRIGFTSTESIKEMVDSLKEYFKTLSKAR